MPSILSDEDKQTVKRTVPKSANKIHAVAVAKLYIAYPDRHRWTYTGLQGAAVLANDLVGNTFWLKMVDISAANRGVIWDQEIYDTFSYNQDRVFFHTFELEDCLAALSFADEKEAKTFKKKLDDREKNAHKNTKNKPFGAAAGTSRGPATNGKSSGHGLLGGLFGHRNSSASAQPPAHSIIPPSSNITSPSQSTFSPAPSSRSSAIDTTDPSWQPLLKELLAMGITEDQIEENADFIKLYIEQRKTEESLKAEQNEKRSRAPPPPPPSAPVRGAISPQHTGSTTASKRGPPPAPPPARRTKTEAPGINRNSSASPAPPSPPREPSPPPGPPKPVFRAPPPIAEAGKFANLPPAPPNRSRASSNVTNPGPPPPPRPPKTPANDDEKPAGSRFGVPPPFTGNRVPSGAPPPPPSRGPVPLLHQRETHLQHLRHYHQKRRQRPALRLRLRLHLLQLPCTPHLLLCHPRLLAPSRRLHQVELLLHHPYHRRPRSLRRPNAEQISTAPTTNARERSPSASANAKQWCTTSSAPNAPGLWTSSTSPNAAERCRPTPAPRRRSSPTEAGGWTRRLACGYPWRCEIEEGFGCRKERSQSSGSARVRASCWCRWWKWSCYTWRRGWFGWCAGECACCKKGES
ncbi:hypothetical protein JI435_078470 [Parastagonospora nodorum SN15]|uniref:WH1 domain-containing protein n=1 Tax=Phaeosphaeria nodorum (strain SN15 / ATCC MYA-4574 / FGSC 10173) TaxID=321614 RepID=A0A7U2HWL5_PHANO|nr:hypothetical protein JI435_078470 [Parastagonospora nodorum SN15]